MTKSFNDLAERIKQTWDRETFAVYDAVCAEFSSEIDEENGRHTTRVGDVS